MKAFSRVVLLIASAAGPMLAAAQDFDFAAPRDAADPSLPAVLHDLAERVLPTYEEDDPNRYLSNLAALQMAIGDAPAAHDTRLRLDERLRSEQSALPQGHATVYDIYVQARAIETSEAISFPSAYRQAFQETLNGIDDRGAYELEGWLNAPTGPLRESLQRALNEHSTKSSVTLEEALDLVRVWFAFDAYRSFEGLVRPLLAEETEKRYVVEEVAIPVSADATVMASLVRPRRIGAEPLPAVLEFTLDRSSRDAREAAAHGYASVLTLARVAGDAAARPRPFETEGDDAWAAIAWIAQQPWSDGRVAMQGSGYGGFVAWAAAKRRPPALRAIATADPMAPGIDFPSPNRIFVSSAYRWVHDVLAPANGELAADEARWRELNADWYRTGRSYRDLPAPSGRAAAVFRSWLNHPSYDRFWQKWLPFGPEFANVDLPVLTVTGYYSAGETAALYYFAEHQKHADADHTLLIGPFDEHSLAHGASASLRGLPLDAVARIDPIDARYEWLEHVLQGTERPPTLSAGVSYEVAGANEWRHAPSLKALEANPLRLYLQSSPNGAPHALAAQRSTGPMSLTETRDLADRTDPGSRPPRELVLGEIEPRGGLSFVTEPFDEPVDLAGRISGELDFTINKQDVDLALMLYEVRASGEHVKLFDPAYAFRASYATDRVHRRLLMAGVRQQLSFQSDRMVGRRLEAGSRLLLTVGINKRADQQINYGAGGDVSEESIEDAGAPIQIRWHEGSFIEIGATGQ
jgi:uncharacterized protein